MDQELIEKKNVLLIGDDVKCASLIGRTLGELGLMGGFRAERDYQNALSHLRGLGEHNSWLILLDLEMSDKAAFAFLRAIKADPILQMIPVVVLAAGDNTATIAACYELGAAGFLIKTGTGPDFVEKIRRACGYWTLSRVPVMQISSRPS
jgi:CheY-like chemotaxis protein